MMKDVEKFIERYGENMEGITYRAGAAFTSQFGLDNTFNELRLHMGVDRGPGHIYLPFDGEVLFEADLPSRFGNLLTLDTEFGFSVRIAHIEKLSDVMLAMEDGYIKAGVYVAEAGRAGRVMGKDGRHTHTEIVSQGKTSRVLDELLRRRGYDIDTQYVTSDVVDYCHANGIHASSIPAEPLRAFNNQKKARNITFINKYVCDRIDYLTGEERRFYSSYYLFDM